MPKTLQPMLKEFATPGEQPWTVNRRIGADIMRSEGYAGHAHPYSLYEEMEDKDPHLASLLQTRKLGVLARERKIEAASEDQRDRDLARWVEEVLGQLPGWNAALGHLVGAISRGMAVVEVLWGFDRNGRIIPRALKPRAAERFELDTDGQWRLLDPMNLSATPGRALPQRKFIFALYGATDERPHGKGLCERVYWYWWFKKHNQRFWLIYNEKFGSPTVVARHQAGLSETERARLLEVVESIQTDAGVTLPEGIGLELLEAARSGGASSYRDLAQWCNNEISQAIVGQTLTSSEGDRSGSLALANIHEKVRQEYQRADAWMLMDVINHQLIRWLVDLNFGEDFPAPRWQVELDPELDLNTEVQIDRSLLQMGVSLPHAYFYEKYGRPVPTSEDRRLQYDDSNLYQYHLQFGILTINEVRSRLGLPPVNWGDAPTAPAGDAILSPTPGSPAGASSNNEAEHEEESEGENEEDNKI